jgi:hypothetical protein
VCRRGGVVGFRINSGFAATSIEQIQGATFSDQDPTDATTTADALLLER